MPPDEFTRALADITRVRILTLLSRQPELCVCEFTQVLEMPQPKISRHLAILRNKGLLHDRREGQWVHYRLHPELPLWAAEAIAAIARGCLGKPPYEDDAARLKACHTPTDACA